MIRHVVLYAYRDDITPSTLVRLYMDLDEISARLPGRLSYTWGAYSSDEDRNQNFTHCLVTDFVDEAARDAFINDPVRKHFSAQRVLPLTKGGLNSIISFDFFWPDTQLQ